MVDRSDAEDLGQSVGVVEKPLGDELLLQLRELLRVGEDADEVDEEDGCQRRLLVRLGLFQAEGGTSGGVTQCELDLGHGAVAQFLAELHRFAV